MKWQQLKDRADIYRIRKQPGIRSMTLTLSDWDKIAAVVDAAKDYEMLLDYGEKLDQHAAKNRLRASLEALDDG